MPIQLSGSLVITGSITTTGVITMSGSIASASYSSTSDLLQGTGSVGFTTTASFNAVSSSQQQVSASYIALSGSYNVFSGSASTRITANSSSIQQVSSSQQQISASLLQVSASYISLSGSYNTYSSSVSTRTTQIENVYATTGSNSFRANQSITGSLVVSSTITAQTLVVQTVTSSIVYSSGSNIFGCDLNSRQTFTGSVLITGSLTIAGASSATSYSGATIFGSTIACSPIGCFATSCATAFIGGTMSGTTIYGSTAVCSAVGKFTTCLDLGGALTGTSATFSSTITLPNNTYLQFKDNGGTARTILTIDASNTTVIRHAASGGYFALQNFANTVNNLLIADSGAATFSSTITGTTIYGSTAVCSPVGKFTSCIDAGSGTFSGCVLIGKTTSAGGRLQVSNGTVTFNVDHNADGPYLTGATDNNVSYRKLSYDASEHIFLISATAKMRITSGGVVSINQTCGYGIFNVTGIDCAWGEGIVMNPAPNGYSAINFRAEGKTGSCYTDTWQLGKSASVESAAGELFSLNRAGLTGGLAGRSDASQQWKTNGDSIFGFKVGIGTCTPSRPLTVYPCTNGGSMSTGCTFLENALFGQGGLTIGQESGTLNAALMTNSNGLSIIFGGWNGSTNAERMRITSAGEILAGTTSAGVGYVAVSKIGSYQAYTSDSNTTTLSTQRTAGFFGVDGGSSSNNQGSYTALTANVAWGASNNPGSIFRGYQSSTLSVQICYNGNLTNTNGSYGTISSDRRVKENIVSATQKLDDLMKLNVVNFNLIGNEEKHIGFIAQDMQEVFPSFVYQSDTRKYDKNGNLISGFEDTLGLKVGMEFAILTKAIQEQQCTICSQASRITLLESCLGIA